MSVAVPAALSNGVRTSEPTNGTFATAFAASVMSSARLELPCSSFCAPLCATSARS